MIRRDTINTRYFRLLGYSRPFQAVSDWIMHAIQDGLKIRFWQQSVGSIPSTGTKYPSAAILRNRKGRCLREGCAVADLADEHCAPDGRTLQGLVDSTGQPLRPPVALENVPQLTSTTVPANQIVMGDFSQLLIGVRTGLRIELLKEAFAQNHQYSFIAHLRADVQLAQPKAFVNVPVTP